MGTERFASHALLELLGHRRIAGYVEEIEIAGAGFLRIDVPAVAGRPAFSQILGPKAIYSITTLGSAEDAARIAATLRPEPLQPWELPSSPARKDPREIKALTSGPRDGEDDDEDDDDEYSEEDADEDDALADELEEIAEDLEDEDDEEGDDEITARVQEQTQERRELLALLAHHDVESLKRLIAESRDRSQVFGPAARYLIDRIEQVARDACYAAPEVQRDYIARHLRLGLPSYHYTVDVVLWIHSDLGVLRVEPPPAVAGELEASDAADIPF